MAEDATQAAEEKGRMLSKETQIVNVAFEGKEPTSQGTVVINFYKKGYSDRAIIHLLNKDSEEISFIIEPFLSTMEMKEGHVYIEG